MCFFNRPINFFTDCNSQRLFENWPGERERMELAIFTARVNICWQRLDEVGVNGSAQRAFVQVSVVHAADSRAKAEPNKFVNQIARIHFPNREEAAQTKARQVLLAPAFEVFEKNVAENKAG